MEKLKQHNHDLMAIFRHYQSEGKYTDVRITAQDHNQTFNCHKLVIAAASDLTSTLLKSLDMDEDLVHIIIPDMTSEVLLNLANFIYGGMSDWMGLNKETLNWFKVLGIPLPKIFVNPEPEPSSHKIDLLSDKGEMMVTEIKKLIFKCPFKDCNEEFNEQTEADLHFNTKHKRKKDGEIEGLLPFNCTFCDKSFAT